MDKKKSYAGGGAGVIALAWIVFIVLSCAAAGAWWLFNGG